MCMHVTCVFMGSCMCVSVLVCVCLYHSSREESRGGRVQGKGNATIKINVEESSKRPIPAWLEKDNEKLTGKVIKLASREDIDIPIEEHLIVELYSK